MVDLFTNNIGVLYASGQVNIIKDIDEYEFAGELFLSGELRKISSAIPMTIKCVEENKKLIVPTKNDKEIGLVETVQAYSFDSLNEVVEFLSGNEKEPVKPSIEIDFAKLYQDLEDVKGQYQAERALEIAAADGHNILLVRISWYWKNNGGK